MNTTWKNTFNLTASKITNLPKVLEILNEAFTYIAAEWVDLPIDPNLPYYNNLCGFGDPLEYSIKIINGEIPRLRFAAKPYSPDLNANELTAHQRLRAHDFIKHYSSAANANLVDQALAIFPDPDHADRPGNPPIFLGLGFGIDFIGQCQECKFYLNTKSAVEPYSNIGAIVFLLNLAGISHEDSLGKIFDLMTRYKAKARGIGMNFTRDGLQSIKVYLRATVSLSALMQFVQHEMGHTNKESPYNLLFHKDLFSKDGEVSFELDFNQSQLYPDFKISFTCESWFPSDASVLNLLKHINQSSEPLVNRINNIISMEHRHFTALRVDNFSTTLYFRV